jgi:DNA invertase Pin-like site-specific DNA recombinase
MKTVAVYLRVSTEGIKSGREQTTESQKHDIDTYLKAKGITEFVVYEDLGISGKKRDRPQLNKMLNDCKMGKISTVVVFKLDRLARSLANLLEIVTIFQESEVEFVSVKDSIDMSTASGRLLFMVLGAVAEFECATIRERVMSGLAAAKSKGIKLGRPFKTGHQVAVDMRANGASVAEIEEHTGLSRKTIYRTLSKGAPQ